MKKVSVVGSLNYDTTIHVENFPLPGETILADNCSNSLGGKGANQAAALAKVGLEISMIGMVGNDTEGNAMIQELQSLGVETDSIARSDEHTTGRAQIVVEKSSNNNIIVIPGANKAFDTNYVDSCMDTIDKADAVLAQLEIPIETVTYAFAKAKEKGKLTVLNPAPAQKLEESLLKTVDVLIPNEVEMEKIYGQSIDTEEKLEQACSYMTGLGVQVVIVTLGDKGCYYYHNKKGQISCGYQVKAVDTTAAGDSFIGGFLGTYLETGDLEQSVDFGQRVAAITVSRKGAIESIPNSEEVKATKLEKKSK